MDNPANLKPEDDKIEIEKQVEDYKDTEGLSTKKLNFGLWFVENKKSFRIIFLVFLAIISAISWSYTIFGFAYYLSRGMDEDKLLLKYMTESSKVNHDITVKQGAQNLNYYPVKIFKLSDNRYDFLATVDNPNQDWWATFDYSFRVGNENTPKYNGFIFPEESKSLMALARESSYSPSKAELIIENLAWYRIDKHTIPDWKIFYENHLDIVTSEASFKLAQQSGLSEKIHLNQLDFTVENKTAYNFWQADLDILLYSGNKVVGVNRYSLTDLMSGEERLIQASWSGQFGRIDKIQIAPNINIMDENIYIKYQGGIGEVK